MRKTSSVFTLLVVSVVLTGCGGSSGKLPAPPLTKDPFPGGAPATAPKAPTPSQPGKISKITVTPLNVKMAKGDTVTFTAKGFDAAGNPVPVLQPKWAVSPAAGLITPSGQFTAQGDGTWAITCESQNVLGLVNVEVG
jgi:hypothetical protein